MGITFMMEVSMVSLPRSWVYLLCSAASSFALFDRLADGRSTVPRHAAAPHLAAFVIGVIAMAIGMSLFPVALNI